MSRYTNQKAAHDADTPDMTRQHMKHIRQISPGFPIHLLPEVTFMAVGEPDYI